MSTNHLPFPIAAFNKPNPIELPNTFRPRDIDILCGRGRRVWDHTGNRRFKAIIKENAHEYATARTKMEKGAIVASMVDKMREDGVLFVRKDTQTQRWHDIGEFLAREKTSHAIRDHIYKKNCAARKRNQMKTIRSMNVNYYDEKITQQSTVLCAPTTQQQTPLTNLQFSSCDLRLSSRPSSPRRISEESIKALDKIERIATDLGSMIKDDENCKKSLDIQPVNESVGPSPSSNAIFLDAASSFLERAQTAIAEVEAVIQQELDQATPNIEQGQDENTTSPDDGESLRWSELFPVTIFDD